MKKGPKGPVELAPLSWATRSTGVDNFRLFCHRYLTVPRGVGAGGAFRPREWQLEMLAGGD